ncbi:hypothetical protein GC096_26005 [Paenibacillus sp. LMG 31461]|uniref:DUF6602 domain-containing protein n=1 Tax=Paenibacillus plantarum TaxID=2654975 RepID=A0ABX1XGH6_9BACL|nr:DUF6602 domain-containing protein [Paenibacillus plantarum]NOU67502.1 hypothetical protein [Paenibacillus plantarum]
MELKLLFSGISKKMSLDFSEITEQISHMGDRGTNREEKVKEFLIKHLPNKYGIGNGQAISTEGGISKQLDCVIYDSNSCPLWFNEKTQIFPAESLCATVEIKSVLTKHKISESIENIASVKRLKKESGTRAILIGIRDEEQVNPETLGCVFAFEAQQSLESIAKNINEANKKIPANERVNLVCILNKGVLVTVNKEGKVRLNPPNTEPTTMGIMEAKEDSLLLFFLFLNAYLNVIEVVPPYLFNYVNDIFNGFPILYKKIE